MNEKQGNEIDEIFRKGLTEADIPFDEAHWRDMNKKLQQERSRRRDILLWASMGGVAAMLIMTLTWWFIEPVSVQQAPLAKIPVPRQSDNNVVPAVGNDETSGSVKTGAISIRSDFNTSNTRHAASDLTAGRPAEGGLTHPYQETPDQRSLADPVKESAELVQNGGTAPADNSPVIETGKLVLQDVSPSVRPDSPRVAVKKQSRFKPELVLTVNAASDISAVNSFTDIKNGSGGGVLATVSLSPKLGITTGAQLARKIYQTGFDNYKPVTRYVFPVNPAMVDADCLVLDVPLNLNYKIWNKGNSSVEVSAGASTYFMLKEKYRFTYSNPARSPGKYQVNNRNTHFMGVGNIAVSYERKLNKNAGIAIQPFAKLPLTEIGYGNVKLISAGISANLNINISKITGNP